MSIEDKRFWTNPGVDIRGIGRAFFADVTGKSRQGASTIAQQFVKNALSEQGNRTVFEKLREAALAYHLTREWSKEKILTEYLNSIYFGNGAYGIESAARVYFGAEHGFHPETGSAAQTTSTTSGQPGAACGDSTNYVKLPKCASVLAPWEAALLAGMVASPTAFDPVQHPAASKARRNVVLQNMYQQGYISRQQYFTGVNKPLPTAADIQQPSEPTVAPYFTSWLRPQILAAMGLGHGVPASVAEYRTYFGGLKIRTTLDLKLQQAAEQAISSELPTGYNLPERLARGDRQQDRRGPGDGRRPDRQRAGGLRAPSVQPRHRGPPPARIGVQAVHAGGRAGVRLRPELADRPRPRPTSSCPTAAARSTSSSATSATRTPGTITLANATAFSDNSVYARLGIQGLGKNGTTRIARMAAKMGIRSPGLKQLRDDPRRPQGRRHAARHGARLRDVRRGRAQGLQPQARSAQRGPDRDRPDQLPQLPSARRSLDKPDYKRILPPEIAATVQQILTGPVRFGTATAAALSGVVVAGKTGTTSNYGDAWFVGWTPQMTTAVWVGYPNGLVSMANDFRGGPVEGGTYPAIIWHAFMAQALQILASEAPAKKSPDGTTTTDTTGSTLSPSVPSSGSTSATTTPSATTPAGAGGGATGTGNGTGATGAGNGGAGGTTGGGGGTTGGGGGTTGGGGGTTGGGGGTTGGGGGTTGGGGGTGGGSGGGGTGGAGLGGGGGPPPPSG